MIIANPIYDVVFKYLLEDIEIARGLLSTIIVVKVNRVYTDVNTGEALSKDTKEPFIENLTHDCYVIQIPFLGENKRTNLEKVLRVFNQKFKITGDQRRLDFGESTDEPLVQKIIDRLNRAIASDEILAEMDAEDEVERLFGKIEKQLEEAEKQLEKSEKNSFAKDKKLKESTAKLKEKDSEIEILRKELEALKKNKK